MADKPRHFVGYHNTERMGCRLSEGDPVRILTNKSVSALHEGVVWMVVGEGKNPRRFSLASVFRVTETGDSGVDGFKHFAAGRGHVFDWPIALNDLEWFDGFKQAMNSFQFGVQALNDEGHIASLVELALQAGVSVP